MFLRDASEFNGCLFVKSDDGIYFDYPGDAWSTEWIDDVRRRHGVSPAFVTPPETPT